MIFSYDAQGRPFAVKYSKNNGVKFTNYFYALNQQGDVVKIFRPVAVKDADGNVIGYTEKTYATYTYDAWGKLIGITNSAGTSIINKQTTSTSLANLNPLRYRGYYYDNETGFYYLQSRYYDPAVKRFINADVYASTDSADAIACNMFAYCGNNPVMHADPNGLSWTKIKGWLERAWRAIASSASGFFGAGSSVSSTVIKSEVEYLPYPLPITAKSGIQTTTTISSHGNSSKPVSVYAVGDVDNAITSSEAGVKINIESFALNSSLALDDIGVSVSHTRDDNSTGRYGFKLNLSELKIGYEQQHSVTNGNQTETSYTNVSASGWWILAAFAYYFFGQEVPAPAQR